MKSETILKRAKIHNGWANFPRLRGRTVRWDADQKVLSDFVDGKAIARGQGKSYGDAALAEAMVLTNRFDHIHDIDFENQTLTCQSGTTIESILAHISQAGFLLPVLPGIKMISIGGAIASDVHGKNHTSKGSFVNSVLQFKLITATNEILVCSREENTDLFWCTFGGMGLTGIILEVKLRFIKVHSNILSVRYAKTRNLNETLECFDQCKDYEYRVAWIDLSGNRNSHGRGIFSSGKHLTKGDHLDIELFDLKKADQIKLDIPFTMPFNLVGKQLIQVYNVRKYRNHSITSGVQHYNQFLFPLDRMSNWNRLYGPKGFLQFQGCFPLETAHDTIHEIIDLLKKHRSWSSLAVLKQFGESNSNSPLSFPIAGFTLSLDFPRTSKTIQIVKGLNQITAKANGRVYLTKDALLSQDLFDQMYPAKEDFLEVRKKYDPDGRFESFLSKRLML